MATFGSGKLIDVDGVDGNPGWEVQFNTGIKLTVSLAEAVAAGVLPEDLLRSRYLTLISANPTPLAWIGPWALTDFVGIQLQTASQRSSPVIFMTEVLENPDNREQVLYRFQGRGSIGQGAISLNGFAIDASYPKASAQNHLGILREEINREGMRRFPRPWNEVNLLLPSTTRPAPAGVAMQERRPGDAPITPGRVPIASGRDPEVRVSGLWSAAPQIARANAQLDEEFSAAGQFQQQPRATPLEEIEEQSRQMAAVPTQSTPYRTPAQREAIRQREREAELRRQPQTTGPKPLAPEMMERLRPWLRSYCELNGITEAEAAAAFRCFPNDDGSVELRCMGTNLIAARGKLVMPENTTHQFDHLDMDDWSKKPPAVEYKDETPALEPELD